MDELMPVIASQAIKITKLEKDVDDLKKVIKTLEIQNEEYKKKIKDYEQQEKDSLNKSTWEENKMNLDTFVEALKTQSIKLKKPYDDFKAQLARHEQLKDDLRTSEKTLHKLFKNAVVARTEELKMEEGGESCERFDLRTLEKTTSERDDFRTSEKTLPMLIERLVVTRTGALEEEKESCERVDIYYKQGPHFRLDVEGMSKALLKAAEEGQVQDLYRLLKGGALVSYVDHFKMTALHKAAEAGHIEAVVALFSAGAPLEASDINGCTPLHRAAEHGHRDVVVALINRGASVDARSNSDMTPLHYATLEGQSECAEILMEAGANVLATDKRRNTPFHWAESSNQAKQCWDLLNTKGKAPDDLVQASLIIH